MSPIARNNLELSQHILKELYANGVREVCLALGNRNAPLVVSVAENPEYFKVFYFNDERSAAFFALGRIRSTGCPVAVITTSGTAAGELLPAAMEGYYSGLPLVLVT